MKPFGASASSEAPLQWNDTRLIIFTEYDDTRRYLAQQLTAAIEGTHRADRRISVFHGPTPPAERKEIMRAFNADPAKNPMRILIATDAAREGLNLQAHCWNLFHFDVPWNPSRMEQRNGRIDRKLQPRSEVFCHYFVYRQRPEDRILQALVRKTETIRKELGSLSQVLEGRLAETLQKGGIRRDQLDRLVEEIDGATMEEERDRIVAEELEETRERQTELKGQIDRLRTRLSESQKW
ncbi:helicase, partial [Myxococcota bacterium]|nr:helicase [Myxococcota bacterium]